MSEKFILFLDSKILSNEKNSPTDFNDVIDD